MTSFSIHPLARTSLHQLSLPEPIARYRQGTTELINTNRYAGEYGRYPCPCPMGVQAKYAELITDEVKQNKGLGSFSAQNVLFTPGSIMAIDLLIRAFCQPQKDRICIQNPTFSAYHNYALASEVDIVDVPLVSIGECYNSLNIDAIISAKAKLTFICNPNNPVGAIFSQKQIIEILKQSSGLVIVDEAYIDFADQPSTIGLMAQYPNLVVLRTFSKAWGLASLRIGAVIAEPSIVSTLRLLLEPFSFTVPAQIAVKAKLDDVEEVRSSVKIIRSERERLYFKLQQLPIVKHVYPSQTNFILVEFFNSSLVYEKLVEVNALVSNMSFQVENALRLSVATSQENDKIIEVLQKI